MAEKAYNAFYRTQFRQLELMQQQVLSTDRIPAAVADISEAVGSLQFPASVTAELDPASLGALTAIADEIGFIREQLAADAPDEPDLPASISAAALYLMHWLSQLRAQVLLDTSDPVTVETSNAKLAELRNESAVDGRYQRCLQLLEGRDELRSDFQSLFADVAEKDEIDAVLEARLLDLLALEWRIVNEVTEDELPEGFDPVKRAPSSAAKRPAKRRTA